MGWAARTLYEGSGMHNTRTGRTRRNRLWTPRELNKNLADVFNLGLRRRYLTRYRGVPLMHVPSVGGQGKWASLATFVRYKLTQRRLQKVQAASRRRNGR